LRKIKKSISAVMVAATLGAASPIPRADAGIILTPVAVGVVMIVLGIVYHNKLLIILDADGKLDRSALEQSLAEKYPFIDNQDVIRALATAIREKADSVTEQNGSKTVQLSRGEILQILSPTALAELNPSAVEGLIQDLQ
jgi:hypothetical protein